MVNTRTIVNLIDLVSKVFHIMTSPFITIYVYFRKIIRKWKTNRIYDKRAYRVFAGLTQDHKKYLHELLKKSETDKFDKNIKLFSNTSTTRQAIDIAINITTYDKNQYGRGSQMIWYCEECTNDALYIRIDPKLNNLIAKYKE